MRNMYKKLFTILCAVILGIAVTEPLVLSVHAEISDFRIVHEWDFEQPDAIPLEINKTTMLSINCDLAEGQTITWVSDDTTKVEIVGESNGTTCTITELSSEDVAVRVTATITDGVSQKTAGVNVYGKPETATPGVKLSKTNYTFAVDETYTLKACSNPVGHAITWTSSNTDVVTVENGLIKGISAGTADITASLSDSDTNEICTVTVTAAHVYPSGIQFSGGDTLSLKTNSDKDVSTMFSVVPTDATNQTLKYSSSNLDIFTVSDSGVIHAVKAGEATLTVTAEDKPEVKLQINVSVADQPAESITVQPSSAILFSEDTLTLQVKVQPDDTSDKSVTVTANAGDPVTVNGLTITAGTVNEKKTVALTVASTSTPTVTETVQLTILPIPEGDIVNVSDWDELAAVMSSGRSAVLAGDITDDGSHHPFEVNGTEASIDLNGHNLRINEGTITVPSGKKLTLKNSNEANSTISGATNTAFFVKSANLIVGEKITLSNNTNQDESQYWGLGGAIISNGISTITINGSLINNTAKGAGAVYVNGNGSTLTLNSTARIEGNKATQEDGGAIRIDGNQSKLVISGATFKDNTAVTGGGAVTVHESGEVSITDARFEGNQAGANGDGGALKLSGTQNNVIIQGASFCNNQAGNGGAVSFMSNSSATITIKDSTFTSNIATNNGGAINVDSNSTYTFQTVSNNTFENNQAESGNGGAIAIYNTSLTLTGHTFTSNTALQGQGGAIYTGGDLTLTKSAPAVSLMAVSDSSTNTFTKNRALIGGAISVNAPNGVNDTKRTFLLEQGTFTRNYASSTDWLTGGGAVNVSGKADMNVGQNSINENKTGVNAETVSMNNNAVRFDKNSAMSSGGAIIFGGVNLNIYGGTFDGNLAELHEGGALSIGGDPNVTTVTLAAGTFTNNRTGYVYNEDYSDVSEVHAVIDGKDKTYVDWGGGAIFNSDKSKIFEIPFGAAITENQAYGFGGGFAGCGTGRTVIFDYGASIFNNRAGDPAQLHVSGEGSTKNQDHTYGLESPVFMRLGEEGYRDYYTALAGYVSNIMYDGKYANWKGSVDGESLEPIGKTSDQVVSSFTAGLTAAPIGTAAKENSEAPVQIKNNTSFTHGGGILNNGTMVFGKGSELVIPKSLELSTKKTLIKRNGETYEFLEAGQFEFELSDSEDFSANVIHGTNDSTGLITFEKRIGFEPSNFPLTDPDTKTFTYYLREVPSSESLIQFDDTVYRIEVTVCKSQAENYSINVNSFTKYNYFIESIRVFKNEETEAIQTITSTAEKDANAFRDESHAAWITIESGFTNRETSQVTVTKSWEGTSTPVNFILYGNGEKLEERKVTSATGWKTEFKSLPACDADGNPIVYTVEEAGLSGYETTSQSTIQITFKLPSACEEDTTITITSGEDVIQEAVIPAGSTALDVTLPYQEEDGTVNEYEYHCDGSSFMTIPGTLEYQFTNVEIKTPSSPAPSPSSSTTKKTPDNSRSTVTYVPSGVIQAPNTADTFSAVHYAVRMFVGMIAGITAMKLLHKWN